MTDSEFLVPPVLLCGQNLAEPRKVELKTGQAVVFSRPHGGQSGTNEDALGVVEKRDGGVCLAVADGVGGLPRGLEAANLVISFLADTTLNKTQPLQERIEAANQQLLKELPSAATTVTAAEITDNVAKVCHAGDSTLLVVGQRGRVKLKTQCHSPVGIKEANGLDEKEALFHPQRHLLNNMMGDPAMWLEKQEGIELAARDTVLLGTDGLWDNLFLSEIVELIRAGELFDSAEKLARTVIARMESPVTGQPSKPDDVSFILYRPNPSAELDPADKD